MRLVYRKRIFGALRALIIPVAIVFLSTVGFAQDRATPREKQLVKRLLSKNLSDGAPERVQLLLALKELAEKGQIADDRTLSVLADNITVRNEAATGDVKVNGMPGIVLKGVGHPRGPDDIYPAVAVLVRVGKRALPQTIRLIEQNDERSIASNNGVFMLFSYFSEDPAAAMNFLNEATSRASTVEAKNRLQKAATYFKPVPRE